MPLLQRELDGLRDAVAMWVADLQESGTADPLGKIRAFTLELFAGIEKSMTRTPTGSGSIPTGSSVPVAPSTMPYRVENAMRSIIYFTIQLISERSPTDEVFKADVKAMKDHLECVITSMDQRQQCERRPTLSTYPLPGLSMPISSGRPHSHPSLPVTSPGPSSSTVTSPTSTRSPFSLGYMAAELSASPSSSVNSLRLQTGPFSPSATTVSPSSPSIPGNQSLKRLRSPLLQSPLALAGDHGTVMRTEMSANPPRRLSEWNDDPATTPNSATSTTSSLPTPRPPPALLQFQFRLPFKSGSPASTQSGLPVNAQPSASGEPLANVSGIPNSSADRSFPVSPVTEPGATHRARSPPAPLQFPFRSSFKSQSQSSINAPSHSAPTNPPSPAVSTFFRPAASARDSNPRREERRDSREERRDSREYSTRPTRDPRSPPLPYDDVPSSSSISHNRNRYDTNDPRRPSRDSDELPRHHHSYSTSQSYSDRRTSTGMPPPPPPRIHTQPQTGLYYSSASDLGGRRSRDSSRSTRSRSQSTGHDGSDNENWM